MGMTEREQVIAELLYLKHDCLEGSSTDHTLDKAIALLKAQEPIVPKHTTDDDWMCGNCANGLVGYTKLDADGIMIYRLSYCPNCGKAVKWW